MGAGRREKSERGRNDSAELGEKKEKGEGARAKQNPNTRLLRTKGGQNRVRVAKLLAVPAVPAVAAGMGKGREREDLARGHAGVLGKMPRHCWSVAARHRRGKPEARSKKPGTREGGRVRVQL